MVERIAKASKVPVIGAHKDFEHGNGRRQSDSPYVVGSAGMLRFKAS